MEYLISDEELFKRNRVIKPKRRKKRKIVDTKYERRKLEKLRQMKVAKAYWKEHYENLDKIHAITR